MPRSVQIWLAVFAVCFAGGWWKAQAESVSGLDISPADLKSTPVGANWLSYNGDFTGRRYSSLSQIKVSNVSQLRTQWVFHVEVSDRLENTPQVADGVMFVTSANDTFALDAKTGRTIWHNDRPITEGLIDDASRHISRGVALWHSSLYRLTDNAHLLRMDARSGHLLWDVPYADWNKNYGATGAPLVVNDKVIVGTSGGDDGVRGFLAAYDPISGKLLWRFWTIPGPGSSVRTAGPVTCICAAAVQHGCLAATIPKPIHCSGAPAIRGLILTETFGPETISILLACLRSIPIPES